eukprot:363985_1
MLVANKCTIYRGNGFEYSKGSVSFPASYTFQLKNYKLLHYESKCLMNGYLRNILKLINNDNIPSEINIICSLYCFLFDEWNNQLSSETFTVSNNKKTITMKYDAIGISNTGMIPAFLSNAVSSGLHCWKFKINTNTINTLHNIYLNFGIWSISERQIHTAHRIENKNYSSEIKCQNGDIVCLWLNFDKLRMSFTVNNTKVESKCKSITNSKYVIAISVDYASYANLNFVDLLNYETQISCNELCPNCEYAHRQIPFKHNIIHCLRCGIYWHWRTKEMGSRKGLKARARSDKTLFESGDLQYIYIIMRLQHEEPAAFDSWINLLEK